MPRVLVIDKLVQNKLNKSQEISSKLKKKRGSSESPLGGVLGLGNKVLDLRELFSKVLHNLKNWSCTIPLVTIP